MRHRLIVLAACVLAWLDAMNRKAMAAERRRLERMEFTPLDDSRD